MRNYLVIFIVVFMILSGCGINTAATPTPNQSVPASPQILQERVKGTKDGVDSFLSLYDYKSSCEDDECFNITPEALRQSGYSVFKYNQSCASFLLYGGEVYPLGECFGGYGVVSMAVYDLDKDGKPEFYFTFSWGSGIHRSQAGYFDPNIKQVTIFDYAYLNKDMMLSDNGSGLKLYSADFIGSYSFTDYTMQAGEYIADIVYDNSKVKLEPAESAPVSTQQSSVSPSASQAYVPETKLCMYADGKCIKDSVITDETQKQIVKNAVFYYLIKDAAWPAVDIGNLTGYIEIHYQLGDDMEGMPSVYYAFEKDGKYCIQDGERYSYITDDSYALLYDLASGYLNTNKMTVKSGGISIDALGCVSSDDGFELTPKQVSPYIQYLDLEGNLFGYIGKKQIFGDPYEPTDYKLVELDLFNADFKQVLTFPILDVISNADKSDFRSYLLGHASWPGKYIVEVSVVEEKGSNEQINQYFFGLNLPEKPKLQK